MEKIFMRKIKVKCSKCNKANKNELFKKYYMTKFRKTPIPRSYKFKNFNRFDYF